MYNLLHVLLEISDSFSFGLLHQVVHVQRLVESLALDITGKKYEINSRAKAFCAMIRYMVFRCVQKMPPLLLSLGNIERAAHFLNSPRLGKLLLLVRISTQLLIHSQIWCMEYINDVYAHGE